MRNAFITGTSSGLGYGLAAELLNSAWTVYGCSRRDSDLQGIQHQNIDLTDYDTLPGKLSQLLQSASSLDLVILNAGILGEIRDLHATPMHQVKDVMEINVWANKAVMDWLHQSGKEISQIVMISSGAAILGNRGWSGYALSKATLNMLAKLYAHEFPDTHISALAPGIIDTPMMDYLCEEADAASFPALNRLREARGTEVMPAPRQAGSRVIQVLADLRERPSGSFIDIREMLEPEHYSRLYESRS